MRYVSKTFLNCNVFLTAIMTAVAGMPQFVCTCPGTTAKTEASSPAGTANCCCCGSCASMTEKGQSSSCCASKNDLPTSKNDSRRAAGSHCTKVSGLPKTPAISTTKSAKPLNDEGGRLQEALSTILPSALNLHFCLRISDWTGHSLAPPADRVISLQRLLI
jgi:hypothetical protein